MTEFGGALDRWLEAPYVDAARDEADYERWCESKGYDPEVDHWQEFEDAKYDEYMGDPESEKEWRDELDRARDEEEER